MRYALGVEYDGSDFRGWQNLGEGGPSVQASLEQALSSVADAPLQVVCAGRTDAGVHGQCQVVHFDTDVVRDPRAWMLGTTTRLPRSIASRWGNASVATRPGLTAVTTTPRSCRS